MDRRTLVTEGGVVVGMLRIDEHSGHAGRADVAGEDGFIGIVDRIASSIDRPALVAKGVVIE